MAEVRTQVYNSFSGSDLQVVIVLPTSVNPSNFTLSQMRRLEGRREAIVREQRELEQQIRQEHFVDIGDTFGPNVPQNLRQERNSTLYKLLLEQNLIDQQIGILQNNSNVLLVGNLQTVTYSVFRDKKPVRSLGTTYTKGYVRGNRTISGTLVFTVFDRAAFREAITAYDSMFDQDLAGDHPTNLSYRPVIPDQLPPFNIIIKANNEYGASSKMSILGVELFNEGMVLSVDDLITENTYEYVARHYEPLESIAELELKIKHLEGDVIGSQDYLNRIESYFSNDRTANLADRILARAINPYA